MKLPLAGRKAPENTDPQKKAKSAQSGRVTESKARTSGRYTPPIPTAVKRSPRWYPYILLGLLLLGVLTIILNYIGALPHSPSNWYTLGSLLSIVVAALLATNYR